MNFYMKPLQESLFRKFRDVIMGDEHISTLKRGTTSIDQECIGSNITTKTSKSVSTEIRRSANVVPENVTYTRIK